MKNLFPIWLYLVGFVHLALLTTGAHQHQFVPYVLNLIALGAIVLKSHKPRWPLAYLSVASFLVIFISASWFDVKQVEKVEWK